MGTPALAGETCEGVGIWKEQCKGHTTPFSSGTHLVKQLPERQICLGVLKKLRQQQGSHNNKPGVFARGVNPAWSAAMLVLPCQSSQYSQEDSVSVPQRYLQPWVLACSALAAAALLLSAMQT